MLMKRSKRGANLAGWLATIVLPGVLLGSFGCAGVQNMGQPTGEETGDEELPAGPPASQGPKAVDPLAGGVKAVPATGAKRDVSSSQQKDFDDIVTSWEQARREGSFKKSCAAIASSFGALAQEHPALIEARHNQAAVLYECGQEAEAMRIWEQLAAGPRPYAAALAQLGYAAYMAKDPARAETLFQRSVDADRQLGSVSARLNLAQILREKARRSNSPEEKARYYREAVDHLRTVLAVDGNNLQAYASLSYLYYDREPPLYEMARLVGTQAIWRAEEIATGKYTGQRDILAGDERSRPGAARRGPRARRGTGAEEEAAARGRELAVQGTGYTPEMKKALGMVHNTMGLVSLKRKEVSDAISSFRRAVEMDPELHEARLNLAALSLNYRDYPLAEENFRAVLASQPRNHDAMIGLGVALRGNRKYDEAEQQYLSAQKLDPQNGDSYFNLGLLYQEYKGIDRANLLKAQQYYREFLGKGRSAVKRRDAEKRIKDIDDTIAALEEADKLQKEAEELQKKMEEQQKKMEEELKKMQEQEKKQQTQQVAQPAGGVLPAPAPGPAPTTSTEPPTTPTQPPGPGPASPTQPPESAQPPTGVPRAQRPPALPPAPPGPTPAPSAAPSGPTSGQPDE
jgi:Tfp pilus assembly protein PilF